MMTEITMTEWENKYTPILNPQHNDNNASIQFETYGDDLEFVTQQPNSCVWTELDGDDGVYIVTGYHLANRISYYVTELPWTDDEETYVTVCKFVVCDCYDVDDEETEPDQDCELCDGEGTYTDWSMN
jgi:hypothetical protein